jgi:WD40 repeat protein
MRFALAFAPDGRTLAVGSPQGPISLWSLERTSAPRLSLRLPGQRTVGSLVFDSEGRRMASSSWGPDPIVEIWDLDELQKELARLGFGG